MMDERLQRRVQRYGWDLAAQHYESLWKSQFESAHHLMQRSALSKCGDSVLDVACGTGLVSIPMARLVGPSGKVVGIDLSQRMVDVAGERARLTGLDQLSFRRMDAEQLDFPNQMFDRVVCAFGLMYFPDPIKAVLEMARVLKPGGSLQISVWGDRRRCGWAHLFEIVATEVISDVCPLFFRLGTESNLALTLAAAGISGLSLSRLNESLHYSTAEDACDAALLGGPVAMAWSRFSGGARDRVRAAYLDSISPWKGDHGYRIPSEMVVASGYQHGSSIL